MRPASRGSAGLGGGPPKTGMVPQTSGMRTAAGQRQMLGTAARLRTGVATGPGNQAAVGVGMTATVNVTDRPVTQAGMSGMKTSTVGMGRLVQDPTYYIGELRKKLAEIATEISNLKREIKQHTDDNSQYSSLERKYEELLKEVRSLEGTLADYNLAMDKVRMHTDPVEVENYQKQLAAKNRRDAQEIDQIFLRKQGREKLVQELEEEISRIHQENEAKINALEPQKLQMYKDLLDRANQLQNRAHEQEAELDQITTHIQDMEAEMHHQGYNEKYKEMERELGKLQKEYDNLLGEQEIANMDPKEANAKVLAKVKEDNRQIADVDSKSRAMAEEIARLKRQLQDLSSDISNKEGDSNKTKYERLEQRDKEMTAFIDKFEESKGDIVKDTEKCQDTIVALLEHISQGVDAETNMPTSEKLEELKDEAKFKEKQLETSKMTMARLIQEKEKRQQEMEKINTLDEKIAEELRSLNDKMDCMRKEMVDFEDIDGLKQRAQRTKEYLADMKAKYLKRKENIKQQVQQLSSQYEDIKLSLLRNETALKLKEMEGKLSAQAISIFSLQEYIEAKGRETDFQTLKDECLLITESLNAITIRIEQNSESATKFNLSGGF